ncbi:predicted protein [Phaeodactylum tricornutum CCAP 1055/1]|uniref:RING-type domain-containing protein n=1 Tax=Phaeodactylum tricornutum (strain CCAP 1055/1) TaxID=556484 RepID=B7G0M7_PHATC|nr:predicted protein [Phaeodactylum tricornutum CCAP 1055/1]EEC47911.1 predicted protein [Phaeodactylum tricornutum CCAP 1055/1]|eukprot:XP_002180503.1 predicted protein [Phaeodactylum tricornutum CCAP 1055/1]
MFWLLFWAIALILFVVGPIIIDAQKRRKFLNYFPCFNFVEDETEPRSSPYHGNTSFHYVLSKIQQDEIRESFILENVRSFTMTLDSEKIKVKEENERQNDVADVEQAIPIGKTSPTMSVSKKYALRDNDASSGDDDDDGGDLQIAVTLDDGDGTGFIVIPQPGMCCHEDLPKDMLPQPTRDVRNGCAICLCPYESDDKITWSSNTSCPHVFHHDCIVDWLMASGRKHLKRLRRQEEGADGAAQTDPIERVIHFPKLCPCCRQDFIITDRDEDEKSVLLSPTDSTMGQSQPEASANRLEMDPPTGEESV